MVQFTHFLMSWRILTQWHNFLLLCLDVLCDVIPCIFDVMALFWRHVALFTHFDVITYLMTSLRTFRCHNLLYMLFKVMAYILKLWRNLHTFLYICLMSWCILHNLNAMILSTVLTSWHTFHTVWCYDVSVLCNILKDQFHFVFYKSDIFYKNRT